jgi:excisionase family DNA binding protein
MQKPAEVAEALNISPERLRQYAEDGRIPFVETPGGHRRYVLDDVKYALAMEKARKFDALPDGEEEPLLASTAEGPAPIRRAPRWQPMSAAAIIADADEPARDKLQIPFIGKPGTSRFIIGQGART